MKLGAVALLGLALSSPAWADVADDTAGGGDESSGEEGAGEEGTGDEGTGDGGSDDDDDDSEDDKGCSHAAFNPVTGLSLVVGVGLVLGLRRRR